MRHALWCLIVAVCLMSVGVSEAQPCILSDALGRLCVRAEDMSAGPTITYTGALPDPLNWTFTLTGRLVVRPTFIPMPVGIGAPWASMERLRFEWVRPEDSITGDGFHTRVEQGDDYLRILAHGVSVSFEFEPACVGPDINGGTFCGTGTFLVGTDIRMKNGHVMYLDLPLLTAGLYAWHGGIRFVVDGLQPDTGVLPDGGFVSRGSNGMTVIVPWGCNLVVVGGLVTGTQGVGCP